MREDKNHNDLGLLEGFLAGTLSEDERKVVEERLLSDQEFINLYQTLQKLPEAVRRSHLQGKLEQLRELEERISKEKFLAMPGAQKEEDKADTDETALDKRSAKEETKTGTDLGNDSVRQEESKVRKIKTRRWWWMGIAASLVVLVGALFWIQKPTWNEQLAEEYFLEMPDSRSYRSPDLEEIKKQKARAADFYNFGDFKSAIPIYEELIRTTNDTLSQLYSALAYFKIGKPEIAEPTLERLVPIMDLWEDEVAYNLALVKLDLKKYAEALTILENIQKNPKFQERVNNLIAEIRDRVDK